MQLKGIKGIKFPKQKWWNSEPSAHFYGPAVFICITYFIMFGFELLACNFFVLFQIYCTKILNYQSISLIPTIKHVLFSHHSNTVHEWSVCLLRLFLSAPAHLLLSFYFLPFRSLCWRSCWLLLQHPKPKQTPLTSWPMCCPRKCRKWKENLNRTISCSCVCGSCLLITFSGGETNNNKSKFMCEWTDWYSEDESK